MPEETKLIAACFYHAIQIQPELLGHEVLKRNGFLYT